MEKICYIIGASKTDKIYISPDFDSFIIAADGGLKALKSQGIAPDLVLGDFDSLGYIPKGTNVLKFKSEKDYTDTFIAMEEGIKQGCKTFILYGCLGGRLDHTIANIQMLSYLAEHNARGFLIGDTSATVIKNTSLAFSPDNKGIISVFSINGKAAKGVTINGLKYEIKNTELSSEFPLGVSNEFTGKPAEITVTDGCLLIIWSAAAENIIHNL